MYYSSSSSKYISKKIGRTNLVSTKKLIYIPSRGSTYQVQFLSFAFRTRRTAQNSFDRIKTQCFEVTDSFPPLFFFFLSGKIHEYTYIHTYTTAVYSFETRGKVCQDLSRSPPPPHSSSSWPFGVTLSSVQGGRFSIGLDSPGKTHYRY